MGLFGPDKITMNLEKYDYKPGDKIKGKIKLNLKKPVHARELRVRLYAYKRTKNTGGAVGAIGGNSSHRNSRQKVYDYKQPVDSEKDYQKEEYDFEVKIPADVGGKTGKPSGELGQKAQTAMKALSMLSGYSARVDWYLTAQLDVPAGLDIKKKQQIVISSE